MKAWGREDIRQERADKISYYTPDIIFLSEHVDVGRSVKIKFITGHSTKALTKLEMISKMDIPTARSWALLGVRDGEGAAEFILMPQRSVQKIETLMRKHVAQNGRKKHPWSQNQPVQIEITRESERTWSFKFVEMEKYEFQANFRYLSRIYKMLTFRGWFDLAVTYSDRLDFKNKPHRFNTEDYMEEKKTESIQEAKTEEKPAVTSQPLPNDAAAALRQLGFITGERPPDLVTELKKHCARPGSEDGMPKMDAKPILIERKTENPYGDYKPPTPLDVVEYYRSIKWMKWPRETIEKIFVAAGLPPDESMIEEEKK